MQLTVATIGRAHGLKGEVALDLRTETPEERLAVGAVLATEPAAAGPLTVVRTRVQSGRWFVAFAEVADRTGAEALRGVELVVDTPASDEDDAWYPHELVGLRAERPDGSPVGEVVGLEHLPAQDALVVREPDGSRTLVPFVLAIVPVVDVAGGRVVVDPPAGLLAADADAALLDEPAQPGEG
ncbi:ribosome maturation factor RimM [Actinotalea fermentans]|uniref:Ribosome maturation factor RimM n=1 Tax=Actinotalea fermentans TaxID=43671 RepID=A0A511YVW9_9CELL|nr:ribosome maturation factor RimM [Actinotalea fermentans]KGM16321.1 16S rRNA processing protein RimM [Actinotalea fermentans ATCC 43279 = JCM 9966 = DSM 3133]GEN79347.1 ribosome maturation factor RimM [Actinotalea fermentans]